MLTDQSPVPRLSPSRACLRSLSDVHLRLRKSLHDGGHPGAEGLPRPPPGHTFAPIPRELWSRPEPASPHLPADQALDGPALQQLKLGGAVDSLGVGRKAGKDIKTLLRDTTTLGYD